jgi:toxin ParE1/3/4
MAKYTLTHKAVTDLSDIWDYTYETWSPVQADKYYLMLLDTCQALADGTIVGKPYRELSDAVLGFRAGQHIIFYKKAKGTGIEVARVLHSRMDLKHRIQE